MFPNKSRMMKWEIQTPARDTSLRFDSPWFSRLQFFLRWSAWASPRMKSLPMGNCDALKKRSTPNPNQTSHPNNGSYPVVSNDTRKNPINMTITTTIQIETWIDTPINALVLVIEKVTVVIAIRGWESFFILLRDSRLLLAR